MNRQGALQKRVRRFSRLTMTFPHQRPDPLIAVVPMAEDEYRCLRTAVALYVSRSLPSRKAITDETELLQQFSVERSVVQNCTPNGLLVPKRHLILEYNLVVRGFMEIMGSLGMSDMIASWHVPLNVRYKDPEPVAENMTRSYPTEDIHTDSWAGESADSVTVMVPIFGDTERNRPEYFSPPPDFKEEWLGPRSSYRENAEIVSHYSRVDVPFQKGTFIFADFGTLHATTRYPDAEVRISIDTTFALKHEFAPGEKEVIHPWREGERMSHADLCEIGTKKIFVFPHLDHERVDAKAFQHPTRLIVKQILE